MPDITLVARADRSVGSRPSRRLRAAGQVPGVVYGHGTAPMSVAVDGRELRAALSSSAGANALLTLEVDGTSHLTMAKELQRHPVRGTVTHVDFVIVRRDEVVGAEVPIVLVGEAEQVHRGDGVVDQLLFRLAVRARPADIPEHVEIDLAELTIGQTIRVSDLPLPPGVEAEADPEQAVIVGQPPQVSAADLAAPEGVEAGVEATETAAAGDSQGAGEGGGDAGGSE
ncbi:MAG: 50S ribosomal protein L25 [Acidimicrobiales bacterium]